MTEEPAAENISRLLAADAAGLPFARAQDDRHTPPAALASTNWRTMQDLEAPEEWQALREWVEWVTVRYNISISMVPNCWWRHDALVEELSALHCAHRAGFDAKDTGNGPLLWHEHFAQALPRLTRAYGGGCSNGHQSLRPRSWAGVTNEQDWTAWVSQSHAH